MNIYKKIVDMYVVPLGVIFCLFLPQKVTAQIIDRLVLELNQTPFTQSQIQNYIDVHALLSEENPTVESHWQEQEWTKHLARFLADMIIDQEALRLGSYEPTTKMLADSLNLFLAKDTSNVRARMTVDQQERTLKKILRVENFKRVKQRQLSLGTDQDTSVPWQQSKWYKELRDNAMIRFFKDAYQYRPTHDLL